MNHRKYYRVKKYKNKPFKNSKMGSIHDEMDKIDLELAENQKVEIEEKSPFDIPDPGVFWTPLIITALCLVVFLLLSKFSETLRIN